MSIWIQYRGKTSPRMSTVREWKMPIKLKTVRMPVMIMRRSALSRVWLEMRSEGIFGS